MRFDGLRTGQNGERRRQKTRTTKRTTKRTTREYVEIPFAALLRREEADGVECVENQLQMMESGRAVQALQCSRQSLENSKFICG